MKDGSISKDNVILFPKLKERLHEQGMKALEEKRFQNALDILQQLSDLYIDIKKQPDVQVGIVICLLELGYLDDAKGHCKRLLNEDIGDYYDILQIYVTILIQLNEYQEVVMIIEALTHESKLPSKRAEHFFQLLDFARKMANQPKVEKSVSETDLEQIKLVFDNNENPNYQLQLLNDIHFIEIDQLLYYIRKLLVDINTHPVVKTAILQLCIDSKINEQLEVEKFAKTIKVIPSSLEQVFEQNHAVNVLRYLEDELESENPTLYDIVRQLWDHYLFVTFPFKTKVETEKVWAASLYKVGYDLHGIEVPLSEVCSKFKVKKEELLKVTDEIRQVQKITL